MLIYNRMKILGAVCTFSASRCNLVARLADSCRGRGSRWVAKGFAFSSSKIGMIASMTEVQQAVHFYEQRNISSALELFQRATSILPSHIEGNSQYNQQHAILLQQLITCYAWKGEISKIQKVLAQNNQIPTAGPLKNIENLVAILNGKSTSEQKLQSISLNLAKIAQRYDKKQIPIQNELVKSLKTSDLNNQNLQVWMHADLRQTVAFIVTSLLSKQRFYINPLYNKLCSTLLKNTQRSSQKNVIKALLIMITNLLRNDQFIQAQGMLQYCLDRKRQNLNLYLLKTNQEFILLNLLLSKSFEFVNRAQQSRRLLQEYRAGFDLRTLLLQVFLLDSI